MSHQIKVNTILFSFFFYFFHILWINGLLDWRLEPNFVCKYINYVIYFYKHLVLTLYIKTSPRLMSFRLKGKK
jgi:hypothetical protein